MKKFIIEKATANKIAYAIDAVAFATAFGIAYVEDRKIKKEEDDEKKAVMMAKGYKKVMAPIYAAGAALIGMCFFCKNPD